MWENFYIVGPDEAPLGEPDDVLAKLESAFPDLPYALELKEQPLHVRPWTLEYLLEWLKTRGGMGYPQYLGYFGCSGVFRFLAESPVMRIEAGLIIRNGPYPEREIYLPKLLSETGWIQRPVKPRNGLLDFLTIQRGR